MLQIDMDRVRHKKISSEQLARMIGDIVFYSKEGYTIDRLVLVGPDVDIFNWNDSMWAFTTRCRPNYGEYFYHDCRGFPLIPYMGQGRKEPHKGGKVVSLAILPVEFSEGPKWQEASFDKAYAKDIQTSINNRWIQYGFTSKP